MILLVGRSGGGVMKKLALLFMLGLGIAAGLATTFATVTSVSAGGQQDPKRPP
jgi:hypothetical protein